MRFCSEGQRSCLLGCLSRNEGDIRFQCVCIHINRILSYLYLVFICNMQEIISYLLGCIQYLLFVDDRPCCGKVLQFKVAEDLTNICFCCILKFGMILPECEHKIFWINNVTWTASIALISILSTGLILVRASLTISMLFSLLSNWSADLSHFLISSTSSKVVDFSAVMMFPLWCTTLKWQDFWLTWGLYTFEMWSIQSSHQCFIWFDHFVLINIDL